MENDIRLNWDLLVKKAVEERKKQKLTQKQLATLAGVSKPTVNKFEQGSRGISVEKAVDILTVLGLD